MLKLPLIFNDNMVLQRGKIIKIWGRDIPNNKIDVEILGEINNTNVDSLGNWFIEFPAIYDVMYDLKITISNGKEVIVLKNICVGEVWVASGQSNMEYYLNFDADREEEYSKIQPMDIRFFDYPKVSYDGQIEEHNYDEFGFWRLPTKEDLPYFSAVAFYFAKTVKLGQNVPIGIIGCNWGGTPACTWLDPKYLEGNEGSIWLRDYAERTKDLDFEKYIIDFKSDIRTDRSKPFGDEVGCRLMFPGLTPEEQLDFEEDTNPIEIGPLDERRPGGLYEMMIKNIAPFSIRGAIWYQGESDDKYSSAYGTVFGNLIKCWRDLWNEDFPFLFVQLAPFEKWLHVTEKNFSNLRIEQEKVCKNYENVWMASSSDAGMRYDIHPKIKKPIGERLGLLARKHVYNEEIVGDAPEFISAKGDGDEIVIKLLNGEGLYIKGDKINALCIKDENGREIDYDFKVIDDTIVLSGCFGDKVKVSFAQTNFYEVNLYNIGNIPAKPFEFEV